jgi:hypothetical protein
VTRTRVSIGLAIAVLLFGGSVFAQTAPGAPATPAPSQSTQAQANCQKGAEQINGKVESMDPATGKLNVRGSDGQMYTFNASKETLQSYKVGDPIKAKLRSNPKC